ncbi:MAG: long-chain fatty acid--CoA ligase [Myxococcaceae bacterium]|nr:long-chain fatty acid--CoA ligase [Myxococcaceae bacterium]
MPAPEPQTLAELLARSTRSFASRPLFGEKKEGRWKWTSYHEFGELVDDLRAGLAQLGVTSGDRVAVIANNRLEWAVGAYAVYSLGAAWVPMYEQQHEEEWLYILADCGAKVAFCANDAIARKLEAARGELPALEHVVRMDAPGGAEHGILTFVSLLHRGAETPSPRLEPTPETLAGLIYTSGTTGNPKGVMLSHANFTRNVTACLKVLEVKPEDRALSFLPWAHAFGQTAELHMLLSLGGSMALAESVDKLVDNLAEVQPTVLISVPRIFNRIYDGLQKRMAAESAAKRLLFTRGMTVAARRRELEEQGKRSALLELQHAVFDRLVFSKVRARFGGRLRFAVSGGAALSPQVGRFIHDLGITVYEGYGLTETSPVLAVNAPGAHRLGSVGKALPGLRLSIDRSVTGDERDGEIIAHGHAVMMGYYKLPGENAKVFTADGGFRTGDMGHLDAEGFLWITGRIKEQYKLENGKYVVPVPIEEQLQLSGFITSAMVHGQNRPFNVAVLVPDFAALEAWAKGKGLPTSDRDALLKHPEVQALYREEVLAHTRGVKGYERPQRLLLVSEDFTTANGMLTQSLKLKRRAVLARYGDAVEQLYREPAGDTRAA